MGLNLLLPATGLTKDGELYAILRSNFNALMDKFTIVEYAAELTTGWLALQPVTFCKDPFGFVHLTGTIMIGSYIGLTYTYFVLPAGFRPEVESYFPNTVLVSGVSCDLMIKTNGAVVGDYGAAVLVNFGGIVFKAA